MARTERRSVCSAAGYRWLRSDQGCAAIATSFGLILATGPASAGGLYLQEFGTPSMGTAEAGAQALASDAATAWHNPAGMSRLEQSQILTGNSVLHSNIRFDADPDTPISGNDGGQAGSTNPILSLHAVHKFGEGVSGGISLVSISGAVLDYNDEWAGRFQSTSVDLLTLSIVPSLAYQVTDWLSIGASLNVLYGNFDTQVAAPPPDGTGRIKIDDADGTDAGVIASALFEPTEGSRFGLVYQSKIQPTLEGQVDVNPVDAEANIDVKIPLAETVRLGAYQQITDRWALLGSLRWENWSDFGDIPLTVERGSQSIPTDWRDTYGFSLGAHFRPTDSWLLQAGFGYDTSPRIRPGSQCGAATRSPVPLCHGCPIPADRAGQHRRIVRLCRLWRQQDRR